MAAQWHDTEAGEASWEPTRCSTHGSSWSDAAPQENTGLGDTAAARFEQQLRAYEREKLACRLKVCCMLQLLASATYAFATPLRGGRAFGLLCAVAAVSGFSASQGSRRALMKLACTLSLVVVAAGALLLWRFVDALLAYDVGRHMSTQRLLLTFAVMSGTIVLVQGYKLRLYVSLLCLAAGRSGLGHEVFSFFIEERVHELLHVDLACTPPEQEAQEPVTVAQAHAHAGPHQAPDSSPVVERHPGRQAELMRKLT